MGPVREINLDMLAAEELECMREAEAATKNGPATEQGAVGGAAENGVDGKWVG